MKRQGYTLAEVLIALGIIGVIAALMLPAVNKYKPDTTKVIYIKTHDSLVTSIKSMAENTTLYPVVNDENTIDYTNAPFYNTASVTLDDGTVIGGTNAKFCEALALSFNVPGTIACSADVREYSDDNFSADFTAVNGVEFMVNTQIDGTSSYRSDIYIDVNGNNGNNCIYSEHNCPKPDRFKFMVTSDGQVVAADPVGIYYLQTRGNWKKSDYEIAEGSTILNDFPANIVESYPVIDEDEEEDDDSSE